jgi:hypothetical protein
MAATAWAFYIDAKRNMGRGTFDLSAGAIKLALFGSAGAGEANTETLSLFSQLSNQVTGGNYSAGGKSLSNQVWTTTDTSIYKFDSDNWIITASGSGITSIKHASMYKSASAGGGPLLCFSQLSTTQISITTGNTLTITMATGGIFTLA